jgi:hypothetical protein
MKERPASEVEAACDAAFAPLCWARLRYSGAKGGGSFWGKTVAAIGLRMVNVDF